MDQGGRLERLAGLLVSQALSRELAQLVLDQRQQLGRGGRIALLERTGNRTWKIRWRSAYTGC